MHFDPCWISLEGFASDNPSSLFYQIARWYDPLDVITFQENLVRCHFLSLSAVALKHFRRLRLWVIVVTK
jgi:hypothetical protein